MHSFIPSTIRRIRNQRRLTLDNVSGMAGMSVQHLSEIESSKRDPRLSSIERIADAMELAVMLVPEHMAPDIRRQTRKPAMTTQLNFSVHEETDDETDKLIHYGTFSRGWAEEDELDELQDSMDAGRISHKQALLRAQKLLL
eukprot:gene20819-40723_t